MELAERKGPMALRKRYEKRAWYKEQQRSKKQELKAGVKRRMDFIRNILAGNQVHPDHPIIVGIVRRSKHVSLEDLAQFKRR